jgi:hypothetical protein
MLTNKVKKSPDDVNRFINGAPDGAKESPKKPGLTEGLSDGLTSKKKIQITLTIHPDLLTRIDDQCIKRGQTRSGFIGMLLFNGLRKLK